tara:strand:- start:534 stop:773 length:240 start_codon:yes stop_codon:yes gene_type:complete
MYGKKKKYLKGGQAKLDMNVDGKLSREDFKMLSNKVKKKKTKPLIDRNRSNSMMNADKDFMGGGKMKNSYGKGGLMQHD